ncbi:hypothetical protein [Psychroflexus aestuariivivens]|uniref:hypothetical protein n=1 Tax=Psychroflexus aestuariivivens TaxID=1795040 RepID=UPI000FD83CDE|nr:hypothetical protein [Psychroflexus aestuariivivens]
MYYNFEFFDKNPSEQDISYRLKDIDDTQESMIRIFIKNLLAFCYFNNLVQDLDHDSYDIVDGQDLLLKRFFLGKLQVVRIPIEFNHEPYSPLDHFAFTERISLYSNCKDPLVERYLDFIEKNSRNFESFDTLVNSMNSHIPLEDDLLAGTELSLTGYLLARGVKREFINLDKLNDAFCHLEYLISKALVDEFLKSFSFEIEINTPMNNVMKEIIHHSDSPIIPSVQIIEVKEGCYNWFLKMVRDFDMSVNFVTRPKIFESLASKLNEEFKIDFKNDRNAISDFPQSIFLDAQAYDIFCTLAKAVEIRQSVCYFYRRMYEEGLILVKDKTFREWYKKAKISVPLINPTETLAKCYSNERKYFVDLVYKLKGLSTDNQQLEN